MVFLLRFCVGLYLLQRHNDFWQRYKMHEDYAFVVIEVICMNNFYAASALAVLHLFSIVQDYFTTFRIPNFAPGMIENYIKVIDFLKKHSLTRLSSKKNDKPVVQSSGFVLDSVLYMSPGGICKLFTLLRSLNVISLSVVILNWILVVLGALIISNSHRSFFETRKIRLFINSFIGFVLVERGVRQSIFIVSHFIAYAFFFYSPLDSFYKRIQIPTLNQWIICFRIQKFHQMAIHTFQKFVLINRFFTRIFFTFAVFTHTIANISLVVGLIVWKNSFVFNVVIISIIIIEFILFNSIIHIFIGLSSSLLKPIPSIYKLINSCTCRDARRKVKMCLFYEMIYSKKNIGRFQLGSIGSITRENFAFFCIFYSSQVMVFLKRVIKK